MPTLPTDIDSFAFGFDLTASNYSGGAGGTFANLVTGGENWKVESATPAFSTKSGAGWSLEGMDFGGLAAQMIKGEMRVLRECTILATFQLANANTHYVFGGTNTAANTFSMLANAYRLQAFNASGVSGYTTAVTSGIPVVGAISFCPENGEYATTVYDGTLKKASAIGSNFSNCVPSYWEAMIGGMRTSYMTGWIARVLVFSRSLHYRDEATLDDLILTEAAKVGI